MESVCWGNSTVGSNPTLSAIPLIVPSISTIYIRATECYIFVQLYSLAWACSEETKWQFKLFITGKRSTEQAGDIDRLR